MRDLVDDGVHQVDEIEQRLLKLGEREGEREGERDGENRDT